MERIAKTASLLNILCKSWSIRKNYDLPFPTEYHDMALATVQSNSNYFVSKTINGSLKGGMYYNGANPTGTSTKIDADNCIIFLDTFYSGSNGTRVYASNYGGRSIADTSSSTVLTRNVFEIGRIDTYFTTYARGTYHIFAAI
jgi:hypothetical protein